MDSTRGAPTDVAKFRPSPRVHARTAGSVDDPKEHARMVIDLIDNPDKARELGQKGRKFVEGHYDWEVTLKPLDAIIAGVRSRTS